MSGYRVTIHWLDPRKLLASVHATRDTDSARYAIDAAVRYTFGRQAAFDHYNAKHQTPDGARGAQTGTVTLNPESAGEIRVLVEVQEIS